MLSINSYREGIAIAPLESSHLEAAAQLYHYSGDYRFATGLNRDVSRLDLFKKLALLQSSNREFFAGIFMCEEGNGPAAAGRPGCRTEVKELVGVVSGILYGKVLWIKLMAILPQFRHRGLGSRAASLLLSDMQATQGIREICLSVVQKNDNAWSFWHRQGFYEDGRIQKKLFAGEQPYEVIILRKKV